MISQSGFLKVAITADAAGFALSGIETIARVAISPWQTLAGILIGIAVSFFSHLVLDKYFSNQGPLNASILHIVSSSFFGIFLPTEGRFGLLKKFAVAISSPFISGIGFGLTAYNLHSIFIATKVSIA